jgi:glycosyltransferase involved in cell wall biosynthesis
VAAPESTSVVIPAFNEAASVGAVVSALASAASWHEIIVIDDGSSDNTCAAASAAGARVIRHPYNKGNGAAVKSGIRAATGAFILIMDADGQHPPADAARLVDKLGDFDLVVGARAPSTHANLARRAGNFLLNRLAGFLASHPVPDLTSGFRGARTDCLREFLYLLPNGFSTPTTTTLSFIRAGYSVAFEPVRAAQREGVSKIRLFRDGARFLLTALRMITIFSPLRLFLPLSLTAFALGTGYAVWTVATQAHVANSSVLLIVLAVIVFLMGLVSEQIAALRFQRRD